MPGDGSGLMGMTANCLPPLEKTTGDKVSSIANWIEGRSSLSTHLHPGYKTAMPEFLIARG